MSKITSPEEAYKWARGFEDGFDITVGELETGDIYLDGYKAGQEALMNRFQSALETLAET